jgi:hypothetical protein
LEAIADPHNIMGAPATGSVLSTHFDALLQAISARKKNREYFLIGAVDRYKNFGGSSIRH